MSKHEHEPSMTLFFAESDESPSKTNSSGRSEIQVLHAPQPSTTVPTESSRRKFSRSRTHRMSYSEDGQTGNATFLTECSFAVSHDRLVQVITDVQPFVPRWEELNSIDLSGKKLESVARLKEFLPRLDGLNLCVSPHDWSFYSYQGSLCLTVWMQELESIGLVEWSPFHGSYVIYRIQ